MGSRDLGLVTICAGAEWDTLDFFSIDTWRSDHPEANHKGFMAVIESRITFRLFSKVGGGIKYNT